PRGLVAATGEQEPPGTSSSIARCFLVPFAREATDLAKLSAAQGERHLYREAMASYVTWLIANYDSLQRELPKARDAVRDQLLGDGHYRQPEMVAQLVVGLSTGLQFAVEVGALDAARADELVKEGTEVFVGLASEQARRSETRRPTLR